MVELTPEVEQQLADMTDEDYRALVARVRPPSNPGQQLADILAKHRTERNNLGD